MKPGKVVLIFFIFWVVCQLCKVEVEDEKHFVMYFSKLEACRKHFFDKVNDIMRNVFFCFFVCFFNSMDTFFLYILHHPLVRIMCRWARTTYWRCVPLPEWTRLPDWTTGMDIYMCH